MVKLGQRLSGSLENHDAIEVFQILSISVTISITKGLNIHWFSAKWLASSSALIRKQSIRIANSKELRLLD